MKSPIEHLLEKNLTVYSSTVNTKHIDHNTLLDSMFNNLFNLNIVEFSLIPEFFLGFSSILLSLYGSLIAYNKRYGFNLTQKIIISLTFLFLFLTLILLLNDCLLFTSKQMDLNSISFCNFISVLSKVILILVSCLCLGVIWQYIVQSCKLNNMEYLLLFIYTILGLILLVSANEIIGLFITIELQGLSLYVISAFKKGSAHSISCSLKYLILGAFSSGMFLFGSSFIYGLTGITSFFSLNFFFCDGLLENLIDESKNSALFISFPIMNKFFKIIIMYAETGPVWAYLAILIIQLETIILIIFKMCVSFFKPVEDFSTTTPSSPQEEVSFCKPQQSLNTDVVKEEDTKKEDDWRDCNFVYHFLSVSAFTYVVVLCWITLVQKRSCLEDPSDLYFDELTEKIIYTSFKILKLTTPLFILILLVGLLFKIAAAPFHLWSLDVYEGSPSSSTIIFAVLTKISIIVVLIKICYYCFYTLFVKDLYQYLSFAGLFSIFIGSVVGLVERKIKTLLTFSSINNIGYLLLGISTSVKSSIQSVFIYLLNYTNANLALWAIIVTIQLKKNRFVKKLNKDFSDIFLLIKKNKTLLGLSIITIFSLAGIPPFVGFLAKMGIFLTLLETKASLNASIAILLSAASSFYYLRILKIMQFEESFLIIKKLCINVEILMSFLHIGLNFFTVYQSSAPWISFLMSQKTAIC